MNLEDIMISEISQSLKKKMLYFLNALAHVSILFIQASEEDG